MNTIIDITNNECYICLETIHLHENDFLEMTCCKNKVHLKCLNEWYNKTNSSTCFICNQTNPLCKELTTPVHYIQIKPPQPNFIIYTKNKLTALVICYIVNFFILINLISLIY